MSSFLFEVLEVFLSNAANVVNMHADSWRLALHESNLVRSKFSPSTSYVGGFTGLYYCMKIAKKVKTRR